MQKNEKFTYFHEVTPSQENHKEKPTLTTTKKKTQKTTTGTISFQIQVSKAKGLREGKYKWATDVDSNNV